VEPWPIDALANVLIVWVPKTSFGAQTQATFSKPDRRVAVAADGPAPNDAGPTPASRFIEDAMSCRVIWHLGERDLQMH
jgi:hypothetical protein